MVIHVVSSGSYSDYRVLFACDSEDRAERMAELLRNEADGWHRDAFAETLSVVDYDMEKRRVYRMSAEVWDNGTTEQTREMHTDEWPFEGDTEYTVQWRWVRAPCHNDKGGRLEVWGTDKRAVAKVLTDRRALAITDPAFRSQREAVGRGRPTREANHD